MICSESGLQNQEIWPPFLNLRSGFLEPRLTALVMLSTILLLLMLAKGLSAPIHSVYLGVLCTVLMEVLLFFLSSQDSVLFMMRLPVSSMSDRVTGSDGL